MTNFTHGEMTLLRKMRRQRTPVAAMCARLHNHTRDEIIEAIDASIRNQGDTEATAHVNRVLAYQDAGIPLINGKEAAHVSPDKGRRSYGPMF
jgi:hypothetical protein